MAQPRVSTRPLDALGVGGLLACCAIWGVNQVAMKIANEGISPVFQAGLRSVLVAILVLLWALTRGIPLFARDGTLWAGIAAGLAFTANFLFIGPGLALTEASRGVLFLYTAPFFVAAGAHFLIPGDRLTRLKAAGLLLAFIGLTVSVVDNLGTGRPASLLGDLYCLVAGFAWAVTTLIVRATRLRDVAPERNLFYELVVSAPLLFFAAWWYGEPGITNPSPAILAWFAYSVVVVVFFSYTLWFWLLNRYPASQVSVFTFLAPIFAVIAGHLLLGEPVTMALAVALALVAFGIYLVSKPARAT